MAHTSPSKNSPEASGTRWITFALTGVAVCLVFLAALTMFAFYMQLTRSLPSTQSLKTYHPPLVSSMYAADGTLIGEFFTERRYLIPLQELPTHLIQAFLAAEDVRFYEHGGVDVAGIIRAFIKNLKAGEIVQGGSTITQQVVKSLLLNPERTWIRKLKEAILAYRIDHSLSKDQILELYLNQIYFGSGAHGVEAAAQIYFSKHASALSLSESALLAGLPKAPSRYSPHQNLAAAKERQRYVLQRMAEVEFISTQTAAQALAEPLKLMEPRHWTLKNLNSFSEEVRRQIELRYGRDGLYKEGLQIYTTLDPVAQQLAEKALDRGLREVDKRHGYRKSQKHIAREGWPAFLNGLKERNPELNQGGTVNALVTSYTPKTKSYRVHLGSAEGDLPPTGWKWTRISANRAPKMFRPGDVIQVRLDSLQENSIWLTALEQEPQIEGAFLAMVPQTGRVLCMVGGKDFEKSQFNRTTQALRQPGSAFKPFIYAAAIDKGFTEATVLIDSPIIKEDPSIRGNWKPANYDRQFWGPILLRKALINSRNVVTVKLLDEIGVDYVINYARRLGINSPLTPTLSLALGASDVSLMEMLTGYSAFANQGQRVEPYLVERVYDRRGSLLEEHQARQESVISAQTAFVMTHLLQGVIQEGTGKRAKKLGRPAAGKTGTTNELKDAWFVGYTPAVLAGAWVGYDDHNLSLGRGETGGRAACPIWLFFMQEWLQDKPIQNFPIPSGVIFAKVNEATGALAQPDDTHTVYGAFLASNPPPTRAAVQSSEAASQTAPTSSFFKSDLF